MKNRVPLLGLTSVDIAILNCSLLQGQYNSNPLLFAISLQKKCYIKNIKWLIELYKDNHMF